jgi:hypothetical protein
MSVASASSLSSTVVMSADELKSFIKSTMRHAEKEVLEAVLVALKSKRKRRTPEEIAADAAKPKRPTSEKQKHWNAFVSQVHAEMKEEDPKAKRTDAMKRAKEMRDAGQMPPFEGADDSDSEEEPKPLPKPSKKPVAPKAEEKSAKPKKEDKPKKESKKEDPAPKPKKETKKAKSAPPPESDDEGSDVDSVPAPLLSRPMPPKTSPKLAPLPPPESDDEEDDEETFKTTKVGNKTVLMNSLGECYEPSATGGLGAWLGLFDAKTKKIKPAPEPEFE